MGYIDKLESRKLSGARPRRLEDFLFQSINNNPSSNDVCDAHWATHFSETQCFYVGGWLWFVSQTGANSSDLAADYRKRARTAVNNEESWLDNPIFQRLFREETARKQFNTALRGNAVYFHKAVTIIVACELAIIDGLAAGKTYRDIKKPTDVYRFMSVIPACWTIADFSHKDVDDLFSLTNAEAKLREATGNRDGGYTRTSPEGRRLLGTPFQV